MYLRSLLFGLSQIPKVSSNIKLQVKKWQKEEGTPACWQKLKEVDPEGAEKLHPNDTSRIMRALEVVISSGQPISSFKGNDASIGPKYPFYGMICDRPRQELYDRINRKTLEMMDQGWIDEVRKLLARYPENLKPFQSIGYREIIQFLRGELESSDLVPLIQQRTRQYAKRQLTWFRKENHLVWSLPDKKEQILKKCMVCLEKIGQNQA